MCASLGGKGGKEDEFLKELMDLVLICVCLYASTCMCALHLGAHKRQKSGLNLMKLELEVFVSSLIEVHGSDLNSGALQDHVPLATVYYQMAKYTCRPMLWKFKPNSTSVIFLFRLSCFF